MRFFLIYCSFCSFFTAITIDRYNLSIQRWLHVQNASRNTEKGDTSKFMVLWSHNGICVGKFVQKRADFWTVCLFIICLLFICCRKQVVHVYNSFLFANLFTKRDRICMAEYEGMGKILNVYSCLFIFLMMICRCATCWITCIHEGDLRNQLFHSSTKDYLLFQSSGKITGEKVFFLFCLFLKSFI